MDIPIPETGYSVTSIASITRLPGKPSGWNGRVTICKKSDGGCATYDWKAFDHPDGGEREIISRGSSDSAHQREAAHYKFPFSSDPKLNQGIKDALNEWLDENEGSLESCIPQPPALKAYEETPLPPPAKIGKRQMYAKGVSKKAPKLLPPEDIEWLPERPKKAFVPPAKVELPPPPPIKEQPKESIPEFLERTKYLTLSDRKPLAPLKDRVPPAEEIRRLTQSFRPVVISEPIPEPPKPSKPPKLIRVPKPKKEKPPEPAKVVEIPPPPPEPDPVEVAKELLKMLEDSALDPRLVERARDVDVQMMLRLVAKDKRGRGEFAIRLRATQPYWKAFRYKVRKALRDMWEVD